MRPPGTMARGDRRVTWKLTSEDVVKILAMDDRDIPHSDIARKFGVTRERIRQICLHAGHKTRRERVILKVYIKEEQKIARRIAREKRITDISDAWKSGMSLSDIGIVMFGERRSKPTIINTYIGRLRRRYGLKLFPFRRANHWKHRTVEEHATRIRDMANEWNSTASIWRIQKLFGYANYNSASASLAYIRKKYPDLLRTKQEILDQKVGELTKLRVVK